LALASLNDDHVKRAAHKITSELSNRDGLGMLLLIFAGMCYLIADEYNWAIGGFVFLLFVTILELSYRLWCKKELDETTALMARELKALMLPPSEDESESDKRRRMRWFQTRLTYFLDWLSSKNRR
jgi:hypothetical protein